MGDNKEVCLLCLKAPDITFGEFLQAKQLSCHYVCLLLSPALYMTRNENNGFYGFDPGDIIKEEKRINAQRCSYCKSNSRRHANFSCVIKKCPRSFHVDCGLKNACQYRMTDYTTYCHEHRTLEKKGFNGNEECCSICTDDLGAYHYNEAIFADCCKESWYHRECLVQMADKAGYFFKCPLCKNEERFLEMVKQQGIFVPARDAAWEMESNAFADQLVRPSECSARTCWCKKGPSYEDNRSWQMVFCQACGGKSIHERCLNGLEYFICDDCSMMGANALLKDCLLDSSQESPTEDETSDEETVELCDKTRPCYVKLRDIRKIHLAQNRAKKYFSGKWIMHSRLKFLYDFKPITIEIPPQVTTKTSPTQIQRILIDDDEDDPIRSPVSKEIPEHDSFENPPKRLKTSETSMSSLNQMLRDKFLFQHSPASSIASIDSSLENRPPPTNYTPIQTVSTTKRSRSIAFSDETSHDNKKDTPRGILKQTTLDYFFR